jgi:hypothetical protein
MDIDQHIARARARSPFLFAVPIGVILVIANLLPAVAPGSALLSLLAILIWFPTALASFALVTWFRDDEWLAAGLIVGLTPVAARAIADMITRHDLFTTAGPSISLLLRAVIAVPVCGGVVVGARWLTTRIVEA